jgi:hypothetical protein
MMVAISEYVTLPKTADQAIDGTHTGRKAVTLHVDQHSTLVRVGAGAGRVERPGISGRHTSALRRRR